MAELGLGQTIFSLALGLGLAAACGFRVFVPLLILNVAARTGFLELAPGFDWIGSTPALVTFGAATSLEVCAYYVPWLDHLLDTIATPAAVVAGAVVTASVVADMNPVMKWTLALVAGGGLAVSTQLVTTTTRGFSTLFTGGLANPLVATIEAAGATFVSLLAMAAPILALALVVTLLLVAARRLRRARSRQIT